MPKIIDHTVLSEDDAQKLFIFFESQSKLGIRIWDPKITYAFHDNTPFSFALKIIQRDRKEGKVGVRYEFIGDDKIGEGGTSMVYNVKATLAMIGETCLVKAYGSTRKEPHDMSKPSKKKRIIKVQVHTAEHPIDRVQSEYDMSKRSPHLAIKPPTIIGNTSYMVMTKLKGRVLFNILDEDYEGIKILSLANRLKLSTALLISLKEQVTDKGIIHGDIKGENIMIDMKANPMSVAIFDYGFSVPTDNPGHGTAGSAAYASPELFSQGPKTPKIDVYSLARVLCLIWRVDSDSYGEEDPERIIYNASNVNLDSLFGYIENLDDHNKHIIKAILEGMLKADSKQRISLDEAIDEFAKIRLINPLPANHQAHLVASSSEVKQSERKKRAYSELSTFFNQPDGCKCPSKSTQPTSESPNESYRPSRYRSTSTFV